MIFDTNIGEIFDGKALGINVLFNWKYILFYRFGLEEFPEFISHAPFNK